MACGLLLAVYISLSFLNDPRGYLGTDTGGKVATLAVMTERGTLDPDIGYWAERWDPDGRVHPLYYTSHIGDRWVNVSTLPMLYLGYPLYELGGYRLILLLPMLGSVLGALAARALARRWSDSDGWSAFWVVGLASPMLIYALDFWEHSLGVAAMAWALVLLVDLLQERRPWQAAFMAGFLFGMAATLRTESLVYGFVSVAVLCGVIALARRRAAQALAIGLLALLGLAIPVAANHALEVATVGNAVRYERTRGTASAALSSRRTAVVGTDSDGRGVRAGRIEEAVLYAVGLHAGFGAGEYLLAVALTGMLALLALRGARSKDARPAAVALACAAGLYISRLGVQPAFVPGLLAASPMAVLGFVQGWLSPTARYVMAVGLLALPIVWMTQFQGGAAPQWGARYILLTGLVLATAGVLSLPRLRPWAATAFISLAVAVTSFGLAWMSIRSHGFGRVGEALAHRPEPALVFRLAHMPRELGSFYGDRRWLTAETEEDGRFAVDVLEEAGVTRFGLVGPGEADYQPGDFPGWRKVGRDEIGVFYDVKVSVTTYEEA